MRTLLVLPHLDPLVPSQWHLAMTTCSEGSIVPNWLGGKAGYSSEGFQHFLPRGNISSQQAQNFHQRIQLDSWRWPQFGSEDSPAQRVPGNDVTHSHTASSHLNLRLLRQFPVRHAHRLIWPFNWGLKFSSQVILDWVKLTKPSTTLEVLKWKSQDHWWITSIALLVRKVPEFPKTKQAVSTEVGCPSELHGKVLLLKIARHEEVKLPLGWPTLKRPESTLQTSGEGLSSTI